MMYRWSSALSSRILPIALRQSQNIIKQCLYDFFQISKRKIFVFLGEVLLRVNNNSVHGLIIAPSCGTYVGEVPGNCLAVLFNFLRGIEVTRPSSPPD